ncbi:MAG: hypothetical protein J5883_08745 [Clostridiales bacterium]|nr:hypothetical protein [Clostridiales bacterium]
MEYINKNVLFTKLGIWSIWFVVGFMGAFICFGTAAEEGFSAVSAWLTCLGFFNVGLVIIYCRTMMFLGVFMRINTIMKNDDDGLVPVKELCGYLNMTREKFEKARLYGIRKKILINMVYDDANDRFVLTDRFDPAKAAANEEKAAKPFIGMSCPGCAAALKIRSGATGICPVCGREVTAPNVVIGE